MAFDYGSRRTGVAVTDPMQTIASPLDTCLTPQIYAYLDTYTTQEKIAAFVVGYPTQKDGTPSPINTEINHFIDQLKKKDTQRWRFTNTMNDTPPKWLFKP